MMLHPGTHNGKALCQKRTNPCKPCSSRVFFFRHPFRSAREKSQKNRTVPLMTPRTSCVCRTSFFLRLTFGTLRQAAFPAAHTVTESRRRGPVRLFKECGKGLHATASGSGRNIRHAHFRLSQQPFGQFHSARAKLLGRTAPKRRAKPLFQGAPRNTRAPGHFGHAEILRQIPKRHAHRTRHHVIRRRKPSC